jgi:tetratricopeptide (TPR) repeat protein
MVQEVPAMMKRALLVAAICFVMAPAALAVGEARLTGKIVNSAGEAIPNAEVRVVAMEKMNFSRSFNAGRDGTYAIFLLDGTIRYEFTYAAEGYSPHVETLKLNLVPAKNINDVTLLRPNEQQRSFTVPMEQVEPDPAIVIYNEGVALANSGDDAGAVAKFEEAIRLDPELAAGYVAMARVAARNKQWEQAIAAGEMAIDLTGEDPSIALILSEAYRATGNAELAAKYRSMAPAHPAALFNEAVPHLNANRDAEAAELLRQALALDETFARAHYELGAIYARKQSNDLAKKHLTRYLELDPDGDNAPFAREMVKYLD